MSIRLFSLLLGILGLVAAFGAAAERSALAEGSRLSRYGNGQPKERTHFVDDLRHGPTMRWYRDGSLKAEGRYEHGKMVGEWSIYTPGGELDLEISGVYENGGRVGPL